MAMKHPFSRQVCIDDAREPVKQVDVVCVAREIRQRKSEICRSRQIAISRLIVVGPAALAVQKEYVERSVGCRDISRLRPQGFLIVTSKRQPEVGFLYEITGRLH